MASHVTYNGITRYLPGGITKINADALVAVQGGQDGIVALIGEADGGIPGVLQSIDDSSKVRSLLRSGPIADAVNAAFAPSNDPLIPGGASSVLIYKTNNSTQSTATLPSAPASVALSSTATAGAGSTLTDSVQIGQLDGKFNGMWIVLRPNTSTQEIRKVTNFAGGTGVFTVASAWTSNPVAADAYTVLTNTVVLIAGVTAGGTTTTIPVTATLVVDEHAGRFVNLYTAAGFVTRKVVSNTTSTLTVTPSLPAAPVALTSYVEILGNAVVLTSRDYGVHTNGIAADVATSGTGAKVITLTFEGQSQISPDVGNFPFLKLLFKGAPTSISDTTAAACTTSNIKVTTGGLTPSAHVGKQIEIDGEFTLVTANDTTSFTVSPALEIAPTVGKTVLVHEIKHASATISGSLGKATGLTTTTGVVGADLTVAFTVGQTLRQLVAAINQNGNYVATVPAGINPDTVVVSDFDFGDTIGILVSESITTNGFKQNTAQLVNYLNQVSSLVTAVRATAGTFDGGHTAGDIDQPIPFSGGTRGVSTNASFQAGFDKLLTVRAHHVVPLIDQDLVNEGFGSTATLASVAAQLKDHVIVCRGAVGSERGGYIGVDGTKTVILRQAAAINDIDIAVCAQRPTLVDLSGNLVKFGPRMQAVLAAGSRAGVGEIGEPLTHKVLKVAALDNDASWDPNDLTDANDLIEGGILFAQTDDTNVTRWCRDLTSWLADDNLAFSEGSVRDVVRFVAYNLRKTLVDTYIGRKAAPATIRNIRNTAITFLEQCRRDSIIVDSTDLSTGATVKAYHSLLVTSDGDTVKLCVGIYPVVGINFILNDISLGLATQSV
ncbi:MAG: hypothetical protein JWO15_3690 [Sphingomonadales bacterium]|nr:hypothetical protein [Sphingomonadales bacterium]